ncbi:MAG: OmpH family outer membrane protein [Bacteroidales bacterium]
MKRLLIALALLFVLPAAAAAQSVGYIDTQSILDKMPQYTQALQQLERLKGQYDTQIEKEYKSIELLFNNYQREKATLSQREREAREQEIISKERSVKEFEQEIYGQEGVMYERSRQYLDPVKEIVQKAIDSVAVELSLILLFDIATIEGVVYQDPRGDITPLVLKRLNLK